MQTREVLSQRFHVTKLIILYVKSASVSFRPCKSVNIIAFSFALWREIMRPCNVCHLFLRDTGSNLDEMPHRNLIYLMAFTNI
jgi:hypothetical protein